MEYRTLEINLISGKDLNKVNLISKMDVYAVVSIEGGGEKQKTKTPVSNDGDTNPTWNYSMKFTVDENLAQQNRLTLVFKLRCERALGDKDIGEVLVPVKELLPASNGKPQFVSYQVRKPSGKPKGELHFSYKLGEKTSGPAPSKANHEPVTAYPAPAGTSSSYPAPNVYHPQAGPYPPPTTSAAAAGPYPPPKDAGSSGYTPPPAGYPHAAPAAAGYPHAAAGYPPQPPAGYGYGYPPPPPPYGAYPPAGGYGYPPQPGYGYPPQQMQQAQPPKKNKFGMGLGAGLLGGALGGLLIGDMVSDAGDYDAGYDNGFDDAGGFDF